MATIEAGAEVDVERAVPFIAGDGVAARGQGVLLGQHWRWSAVFCVCETLFSMWRSSAAGMSDS